MPKTPIAKFLAGLPAIFAVAIAAASLCTFVSCRHATDVQIDTVRIHDTLCGCDTGWHTTYQNQTSGLIQIQFVTPKLGYAVGMFGLVVKTTDGGESWNAMTPTSAGWLYDLHFFDEMTGLVVGDDPVVYRTTNGGVSWTSININTFDRLRATGFSGNVGFVTTSGGVGGSGSVFRTSNAGLTWTSVYSEQIAGLYSVSMHDTSHGVILGKRGFALYTANGGFTWNQAASEIANGTDNIFSRSVYVSPDSIFAVGVGADTTQGFIAQSTDAGRSWVLVSQHDFGIQALAYGGGKTITIAGYRGQILKSADLGVTWMSSMYGSERWISGAYPDPEHLALVGGNVYGNGHIGLLSVH